MLMFPNVANYLQTIDIALEAIISLKTTHASVPA